MPAGSARVPLTVLGGYLGAGKTTLVNHLLRNADGLRIAVLVNDFGAIAIDADLIEAADDEVISIAGGCVCCSFGSDLIGALQTMAKRDPPAQHVLVEASGVALPDAIAQTVALLPAYALDGVVVLADAETVRVRAADRYMGDTITRQLGAADLVVLNKCDLVSEVTQADLASWLASRFPQATLITAEHGRVSPAVALGDLRGLHAAPSPETLVARPIRGVAATHDTAQYVTAAYRIGHPLDVAALAAALGDPRLGLLRAKGVLKDIDGTTRALHVVGSRSDAPPAPAGTETGHLVCIGLRERVEPSALDALLARLGEHERNEHGTHV